VGETIIGNKITEIEKGKHKIKKIKKRKRK